MVMPDNVYLGQLSRFGKFIPISSSFPSESSVVSLDLDMISSVLADFVRAAKVFIQHPKRILAFGVTLRNTFVHCSLPISLRSGKCFPFSLLKSPSKPLKIVKRRKLGHWVAYDVNIGRLTPSKLCEIDKRVVLEQDHRKSRVEIAELFNVSQEPPVLVIVKLFYSNMVQREAILFRQHLKNVFHCRRAGFGQFVVKKESERIGRRVGRRQHCQKVRPRVPFND